jgi:hypothetical protein
VAQNALTSRGWAAAASLASCETDSDVRRVTGGAGGAAAESSSRWGLCELVCPMGGTHAKCLQPIKAKRLAAIGVAPYLGRPLLHHVSTCTSCCCATPQAQYRHDCRVCGIWVTLIMLQLKH